MAFKCWSFDFFVDRFDVFQYGQQRKHVSWDAHLWWLCGIARPPKNRQLSGRQHSVSYQSHQQTVFNADLLFLCGVVWMTSSSVPPIYSAQNRYTGALHKWMIAHVHIYKFSIYCLIADFQPYCLMWWDVVFYAQVHLK